MTLREFKPTERRWSSALTPEFVARFWSKVERRGPDECWPWRASRSKSGYGGVFVPAHAEPAFDCSAHRIAFAITHGETVANAAQVVRHSCDNRACLNPAHLLGGTQSDNMRDKVARGRDRTPRGEAAVFAKLTDEKVRSIWRWLSRGETPLAAAAWHGVSRGIVYEIRAGRAWRHVQPVQESPGAAYDPGVACG